MIKAILGEKLEDGWVRCRLCAHQCRIAPGKRGLCGVRKNAAGELVSLNADRVAAANIDPIEKKPLYHFLPGSRSFSVAAMGCNFSCRFCQNHSLSVVRREADIEGEALTPQRLVALAREGDCRSISYTYTEPTVFFELVLETAQRARAAGLRNVLVSNGYLGPEALALLAPFLDGANIDLKAFRDEFYQRYCSARLGPVLETIAAMKAAGIWIEVTTLLIPGLNDDPAEIEDLIGFLLGLGGDVPWHVSRFFPCHLMAGLPPTEPAAIRRCLERAEQRGIRFVYGGNFADDRWSQTRCPRCRKTLIERHGYRVTASGLSAGACSACGARVAGVWQ